jgi:hypothetical protein
MRTRLVLLVAALATTALLVGPVAGASAKTVPFAKKVPISGTAKNGKAFKGTYTIDRFAKRDGKLYAVGTVRGKLGQRAVTRRHIVVRMRKQQATGARSAATCQVLNLVLAPLDLNLLGLKVHLNQVVLNITGETGAGNLLGNLVCAVTGILDPQGGLQGLVQFLNTLLGSLTPTAL